MSDPRCPRSIGVLTAVLIALAVMTPATALEVGQKAPDVSMVGLDGKPVKLADLTAKGPVVLYTFIQAFTAT
jgi:peroxiredoxin Q/BCP